ncbi:PEGA domain-containing protein [Marinobacter sp. VGCF2001]|uniref:MORN repeat-containing protein n=1 Tax=Marinobacter sp. VGCF2001 TaxID=3417189 RepID=UPI003CECDFC9
MVDFRPLLFLNALALMLLVTAGFASVRTNPAAPDATPPAVAQTAEQATTRGTSAPEPEPDTASSKVQPPPPPATLSEPFAVAPLPERSQMVAKAEPVTAIQPQRDVPATSPKPEPPKTGTLVLRSNVVGDQVTINGKAYGATRLDLQLDPGRYDITIQKPGYQSWSDSVALEAGQEMTLVGKLEAFTTVNYQDGEWRGGITTGDGTWEDTSGLRYEGHFVDGKFEGTGTAWYADGSRYDGDWKAGQRHGEGRWRDADGTTYTGQLRNDQFHGRGTLTLANGDILTGAWEQGRMNGHGSLTTSDGMLYVGGFRQDEFHGQGALTYPDGRSYEGEFSNGEFHGSGSEIFADGKKYDGQYMEGKFHGKGLLRNPNGSSIQATFRHGEPYGQVRLTTAAGEVFTARTTEPGVCYREKSYRATQCPSLEGW